MCRKWDFSCGLLKPKWCLQFFSMPSTLTGYVTRMDLSNVRSLDRHQLVALLIMLPNLKQLDLVGTQLELSSMVDVFPVCEHIEKLSVSLDEDTVWCDVLCNKNNLKGTSFLSQLKEGLCRLKSFHLHFYVEIRYLRNNHTFWKGTSIAKKWHQILKTLG